MRFGLSLQSRIRIRIRFKQRIGMRMRRRIRMRMRVRIRHTAPARWQPREARIGQRWEEGRKMSVARGATILYAQPEVAGQGT